MKKQKISTDIDAKKVSFVVYEEGKEIEAIKKANELRDKDIKCITVAKNLFDDELKEMCDTNGYEIITC